MKYNCPIKGCEFTTENRDAFTAHVWLKCIKEAMKKEVTK